MSAWTHIYIAVVCSKAIPLLSWFLFCDFWLFRENMWWLIMWHLFSQTSYWISRSEKKILQQMWTTIGCTFSVYLFSSVFSYVSFLFRFLTKPLQLFLLWNCYREESILSFPPNYLFKSWEVIGWHMLIFELFLW